MSDSEIIWKFLTYHYTDNHTVIYLYCCGNVQSAEKAKKKIKVLVDYLFKPIKEQVIYETITGYLNHKKKQYKSGKITIRPIY